MSGTDDAAVLPVAADASPRRSPAQRETKPLSDLHQVVREALGAALGGEVPGPLLMSHACDRQGRNWNVSGYTPTQHRTLIDELRDRYVAG